MTNTRSEIRICESCGLRYPLVEGHPFGTRCPMCLGTTRVVLRRELIREAGAIPTSNRASIPAFAKGGVEARAVLLDNIRSAWNVGSILRSADGFGFTQAYLCGITPTPENDAVTKTSLGAEASVSWSYHKDAVKLISGLKPAGWRVFALEEDERSLPLGSADRTTHGTGRSVFILGNEVTGVDPDLLDLCDQILYIPMGGEKRSFNVAIAFGIAAFALTFPARER